MNNQEKIEELKKRLKTYSKSDDERLEKIKEKQEITRLKKEIRSRKYAGVVQTGRNIKVIGKNIGIIGKSVGKGFGKFIGEDPQSKGKKKKVRSVEEIMASLPQ